MNFDIDNRTMNFNEKQIMEEKNDRFKELWIYTHL